MLQVRTDPCYFASAHWSELAVCLQPQEGHEIDLTKSLEAGAKRQAVAKGTQCSQTLALGQPSKSKGTCRQPCTKPQDINLISGSWVLTGMNHQTLALLPPSRLMSQPFIPQPLHSHQAHVLSVLSPTSALPLETEHQPKEVRRLRNWVRVMLWIRKRPRCTDPFGESGWARGAFNTQQEPKEASGVPPTLCKRNRYLDTSVCRWGTTISVPNFPFSCRSLVTTWTYGILPLWT